VAVNARWKSLKGLNGDDARSQYGDVVTEWEYYKVGALLACLRSFVRLVVVARDSGHTNLFRLHICHVLFSLRIACSFHPNLPINRHAPNSNYDCAILL
jgi:hypothetical protein